uniref:Transient receptor potential cation channel subfamily A member 1 n=1 Tax=Lygus hesperus TaxID=30085 RepID=A0A0A9YDP2_LYGHE
MDLPNLHQETSYNVMDVMTPDDEEFNGRLLHQSALWDNAELLEDLLRGDQLSILNSQDSCGRTPLHAASTTENSTCLRILLQAGADPNIHCGPRGDCKKSSGHWLQTTRRS